MEVWTTGCYHNTSSVVHLRSSPLFIPDGLIPPFPCPFNTIPFGYSTARRFATSACTAIAKVHLFSETPSSFIQHVKELIYNKLSLLLQDTPTPSGVFYFIFFNYNRQKPVDIARLRLSLSRTFLLFFNSLKPTEG